MLPLIICASVGFGVAALIGGVAFALRPTQDNLAEDRLSALTGTKKTRTKEADQATLLTSSSLDDSRSMADVLLSRFGNIEKLMEQADAKMSGSRFLAICGLGAAAGTALCVLTPVPNYLVPLFAGSIGSLPLVWLILKRKKRLGAFSKQLPEALELLGRSLRAGHSLAAGFGLVSTEMKEPLGREFGRAFEEQNLGVSLDEALEDMTERVPNLDLRFFATAVLLQRQTGGDLAEILDKIGTLIRERFKLAGQIQALTGEGRLSGIVLLALPPSLFVVMLYLNYEYAMVLFRDEAGRKMLALALVAQFVGALVIRKIINIKV